MMSNVGQGWSMWSGILEDAQELIVLNGCKYFSDMLQACYIAKKYIVQACVKNASSEHQV